MSASPRSTRNFREAKDFEAVLGELSGEEDPRVATFRKSSSASWKTNSPEKARQSKAGRPALHAAGADARPARPGQHLAQHVAVGAVVVKDGIIVGRGWTQAGGRPHAEPEALRRAGEAARGATLYVTLEPCSHFGRSPPCADAVIAAGIARVVSAVEDPNPEVGGKGHARLRAAGIAVDVGLCAEEAARDHAGHFRRIRDHRPQVLLKLAVSADDKIGVAGRKPVAITGEAARTRVHMSARAKRRHPGRHRHGAGG